jgi:hypothetical protein
MARGTKSDKRAFLDALFENGGSVKLAAAAMGIPRRAPYTWRIKDCDFADEWARTVETCLAMRVDDIEDQVMTAAEGQYAMKKPQLDAATRVLNAKASDRGWIYRSKQKVEHSGRVHVKILPPPDWEDDGSASATDEK